MSFEKQFTQFADEHFITDIAWSAESSLLPAKPLEKAEATTGKKKAWTRFTILPPILLSSH